MGVFEPNRQNQKLTIISYELRAKQRHTSCSSLHLLSSSHLGFSPYCHNAELPHCSASREKIVSDCIFIYMYWTGRDLVWAQEQLPQPVHSKKLLERNRCEIHASKQINGSLNPTHRVPLASQHSATYHRVPHLAGSGRSWLELKTDRGAKAKFTWQMPTRCLH